MCEEFSLAPSEAERELIEHEALVFRVLEARDYERTHRQVEAAQDEAQQPTGPLADLYWEIHAAYCKAKAAERAAREA